MGQLPLGRILEKGLISPRGLLASGAQIFNLTITTFYFILSALVIARLSVLRYFLVDLRRLWMTGL